MSQTPSNGWEYGFHPSLGDPAAVELRLAIAEAGSAGGFQDVAGLVGAAGRVAVVELTEIGAAVA